VKIKTFQPINGGKVFRGKLVGLEDLVVVLEQDSGETLRIPLDNVSKASLEVVL
jgi:ribosome maturation factor RimP